MSNKNNIYNMNQKKAAILFFAGLTVCSAAFAQSIKSVPALEKAPEVPAAVSLQHRAPLNADRVRGTKIFGTSISNGNRVPAYLNFFTKDTNYTEHVGNVKTAEDEENDPYNIMSIKAASTGGNGEYYAFKTKNYSIGPAYPISFEKIDPKTGKITILKDLSDLQANWTQVYSLAYNPKDGKLYGLIFGTHTGIDGGVASSIVEIDKKTGSMVGTPMELLSYYYAVAFNYDGQLFGISWKAGKPDAEGNRYVIGNNIDEIDLEDGTTITTKELKVEDKPFIGYYQHGLGFDYSTGDLYWFATNIEGYQYLIRINPDNFSTEKLGNTGFANVAIGPHIEYRTAEDRKAPAMPTNLSFTIDPSGENKVTLNWTNPSTTWNRRSLTDLSKVYVYRDNMEGTPVAQLDATAGATMSWTDTEAAQGVHSYYIVGVNAAGKKGVPEKFDAFVGRDVPGPVSNLAVSSADGKTVQVKWDLPTRGDNDGWYDNSALTYKVVRQPDNVVLAESISAKEYKDVDLPLAQTYTYEVYATNAEGQGSKAVSEGILAGNSMSLPFSLDFKSQLNASRFTVIDRNGDNQKFLWDYNSNDAPNYAMKLLLSEYENDDILVTPPLNVRKDKSYKVEYTVSFGRMTGQGVADNYHDFAITAGDAPTDEAQQKVMDIDHYLVPTMYHRGKITGYFTAPYDGDYYVGLEVLSKNIKLGWVYVEDINIIPLADNDIEATSFSGSDLISNKSDNKFEVEVLNVGKAAVKDYSVEVVAEDMEGNAFVIATTKDVPEIKAKATKTVKLSGFNKDIKNGEYMLYAQVKMEGDDNTDNDMTPAKAIRVVSGNASVSTGSDREFNTNIPVYFNSKYSATQTVYTPEMTGLGKEPNVTVYGIGVPYTADRSLSDIRMQVYLGSSTLRNGYSSSEKVWETEGAVKCYDGIMPFVKGDGIMYFEFDTPFVYNGASNLIVSYNTLSNSAAGSWPVRFAIFDTNWNNQVYHSVRYNGESAFDCENPASQYALSYPFANELYLVTDIATNSDSVKGITVSALRYNAANGVLTAPTAMSEVSVYTLDGALIKRLAPNADAVRIGLEKGAYLITAKDAAGTPGMILKAIVK